MTRRRRLSHYRKNPIEDDLFLLALLAGGAYYVWTTFLQNPATTAVNAVSAAYNTTVNAVSNAMTAVAGPSLNLSSYVPVEFPDNSVHTVSAALISASGTFTVPSDSSGTYVTAAVAAQWGGSIMQLQGYPSQPGGTNGSFIAQQLS
jgi:hypothetical protein